MVQPVTDMTRTALGDRLATGSDEYLDMFDEKAVFGFPFGVSGPVQVRGKLAMAQYLESIEGSTVFDRFDLTAAHAIQSGGMILEYRCEARAGRSATPFRQNYVCLAQTHNGRIHLYREYLDPLNIPGAPEQAAATPLDRTPLTGTITSLDDLLKEQLGDRLDPGAKTFLDMFAEDGVHECPFAPPHALHRLQGKDAISRYYEQLTAVQGSNGMVLTAGYPTEDARFALLEYSGIVENKRDGSEYRQQYLAVVRVNAGRITLFVNTGTRCRWSPHSGLRGQYVSLAVNGDAATAKAPTFRFSRQVVAIDFTSGPVHAAPVW